MASAVGLFRSKWFAIGMLVALGAWVFHVAALAMAPLSVVQACIAGGLVFLTVLAERWFGCSVGMRQWAGVGLTALGLVLLAVTLPTHGNHSSYSLVAMIAFESALLALCTFLVLSKKLGNHEHHGVMLGVAAGLLFTVTHVAVKALTGNLDKSVGAIVLSPYLPIAIAGAVAAFFASARSLQVGEAVAVIAVTSIASNASAIPAGVVVFGDPVGNNPVTVTLRCLAFVLVVAAAALIPGPTRAAAPRMSPAGRFQAQA